MARAVISSKGISVVDNISNQDVNVLLGACGLYCGACYHHRASSYERDRLIEEAARRGIDPEGFTCQGCRSDILYIYSGCAQCQIRACVEKKRILHCGMCPDFPCNQIKAFQSDGRIHHRDIVFELENLSEMGSDRWLLEQAQRWKCKCGESYGWYEETCHKCGQALDSYGTDPTVVSK